MANQPRPDNASTQTQGQLPQGSYASSCMDARMDGQTLIQQMREEAVPQVCGDTVS
jgi:hypothetical protein